MNTMTRKREIWRRRLDWKAGVDGRLPTIKLCVPANKYTDDAADCSTPILASAGILAAIAVFSLVCGLGRRRCFIAKGILSALLLCCL